jgi:hypothetical protein
MAQLELERLPGAEVVPAGIADLEAGRASIDAGAVQCAHSRYNAILARVASFAQAAERARGG